MRRSIHAGAFVSLCALAGCGEEPITREEAQEALEAANLSSEAQALTVDVIEVSTSFTIGKAVRAAAEELRDFAKSQIPCATLSLDGSTLTIDFGELGDACTFKGHTYAGVAEVTVMRTEGELYVHHEWIGLSNGNVELNGSADVTWSAGAHSRHVVHDVTWTDVDEPTRQLEGSGDITQTLIDPELGLAGGIVIDGERDWSIEDRTWHLDVNDVEARGQDPVPQAGQYVLTTPKGKTLTLSFVRVSPTAIEVTAEGGKREVTFRVISVE